MNEKQAVNDPAAGAERPTNSRTGEAIEQARNRRGTGRKQVENRSKRSRSGRSGEENLNVIRSESVAREIDRVKAVRKP